MRNALGFIRIAGFFASAFIVWSCAQVVAPSGGPKDTKPPVLLSSHPQSNTVNFSSGSISFTFDEYVVLKNIEKELIISPPLTKDPVINEKGKSIVVKLKDTLRTNTTYSFYFGNSIVDYTEGNAYQNFNYAFSTGPLIDSLSVSGRVLDAFTLEVPKSALAVLYRDFSDSVPRKTRPVYVSRTNDKGEFTIRNVASGKYRLLALVDNNSDYMYNLPNEMIAFVSDSVVPVYIPEAKDTLNKISENEVIKKFDLRLFSETDSTQRVSRGSVVSFGKLMFTFRLPAGEIAIRPVNEGNNYDLVQKFSGNRDTLTLWVKPEVPDSLHLIITENGTVLDTISSGTAPRERAGSKKEEKKPLLALRSNLENGSKLGVNQQLLFYFTNPLISDSLVEIKVARKKAADTVPAVFRMADNEKTIMTTSFEWKSGEEYSLILPEGCFSDIYSNRNDSLTFKLQVIPKDEYGNLKITLKNFVPEINYIVQLLGPKEAVIREVKISNSGIVNFSMVKPGKYELKLIADVNKNGLWDTGSLLHKIQPEKVHYFSKELVIKANWDLEEDWDLNSGQ